MNQSSRDRSITIEYQDVIPSTDLPPYIKGKMQCYLHVVVGKLTWKKYDCNDFKLPLPTSTYIRLRWWGDTSQGTYFRPQIEKFHRIIKCRSQFCIRSMPQQIVAYFKDMGSATFDILQSPNSIPMARALVPAVVSLSFNCSIRGAFPVRTSSGETLGELQVAMSFKPRKCDCDEVNLEALGTPKTICYRACPPRLQCFVRKQKELREGRIPYPQPTFGVNSKGSSCYTTLSATGRYGMRSCICEDENTCPEALDCNEGATTSNEPVKCYAAASQSNKCTSGMNQPPSLPQCVYDNDSSNDCQLQYLSGLIEQTKQLNENLVSALSRQNQQDCPLLMRPQQPQQCCRCFARVSIHALQLHESLQQLMSYPDASCPMASHASQNMRQMYVVEYKFPQQLLWSSYDSTFSQVKSVNTWPGGLVRFDQSSVTDVVFSPDTMCIWIQEILKFTVLRRDVNCSEASVIGTAELSLRCLVEDPQFSFSGCLPVTECGGRRFRCPQTHATLQVSINLSSGNKPFPVCAFAQEPPTRNFVQCKPMRTGDKCKADQKCRYKSTAKTPKNPSGFCNLMAKPCMAKTKPNKNKTAAPLFVPSCLFLYVYMDRAENIPAPRIDDEDCSKCFPPNIYLVCRSFSLDNEDGSRTCTVWNNHNPSFQFAEQIPIKIDDQFLETLENKSVVVEVWTKMPQTLPGSDKLMGLVRLPLTYFYDLFKDHDIATVLAEQKCPFVPINDFLPIVDIFTNEERGQLKLVFALGTCDQISCLRKSIENSECEEIVRAESNVSDDLTTSCDEKSSVEHTLRLIVHGMQGFTPCSNQICGKLTNCYIEYCFPSQKCCNEIQDCDASSKDSTFLKYFKTRTKPCVRNPQWEHKNTHKYFLPAGVSLQSVFASFKSCVGKELRFQLWASEYCVKQSDQLVAKGSLPVEKLSSLLSCRRKILTKETFQIPLKFITPCNKTAGDLFISMKYTTKPSDALTSSLAARCCQDVKMRFTLIQASGLMAGLKVASNSDGEEKVSTYAAIKTAFIPQPQTYITRSVPDSYNPEYNHCVEVHCPVVYCDDASTPLAELLDTGCIEVQIWQGFSSESSNKKSKEQSDVLIGEAKIPTRLLFFKTKGFNSWRSLVGKSDKAKTVGAIQVSLAFSSDNALNLILDAARELNWCPMPGSQLEAFFDIHAGLKPYDKFNTDEEYATFRVNITNLWLPKHWLGLYSDEYTDKKKKSYVYLRYKFHDFDTYRSKQCLVFAKKSKKKEESNRLNLKISHQKAFLCKPTQCLFWYLKEEIFEIQVWHTNYRRGKKRPRDSEPDILLGSLFADLSPLVVRRLQTAQHICNVYPLIKAGVEDLCDSLAQVCLHLIPGNDIKAYETDDSEPDEQSYLDQDDTDSDETDRDKDYDKNKQASDKDNCFSAIVSIEKAMCLPPAVTKTDRKITRKGKGDLDNKDKQNMGVNLYVSYPLDCSGKEEKTRRAIASPNPVWNDSREVQIDRKVLDQNGGKIVFQICQNGDCSAKLAARDRTVGYATVDLSTLSSGFPAVNGWYNVLDQSGKCQGEIKIGVTPTDPAQFKKCAGNTWESCHRLIHTIPLLCPVVGSMGTIYIPGISGLADTVASSFLREQELRHPEEPRRSYKNFDDSSYISENMNRLHKNTLQQNMAQLDHIRNNLQRNRHGYGVDTISGYSAYSARYIPSSTPLDSLYANIRHPYAMRSEQFTYLPDSSLLQQSTDNQAAADEPLSSFTQPTTPSHVQTDTSTDIDSQNKLVTSPTPTDQPAPDNTSSHDDSKADAPTSETKDVADSTSEPPDSGKVAVAGSEPPLHVTTSREKIKSPIPATDEDKRDTPTAEPIKDKKADPGAVKLTKSALPPKMPVESSEVSFEPSNTAGSKRQQLQYFSPTAEPQEPKLVFPQPAKPSTPASKASEPPKSPTNARSKSLRSKPQDLKSSGTKLQSEAKSTSPKSKLRAKPFGSRQQFQAKSSRLRPQRSRSPTSKFSSPTLSKTLANASSRALKNTKSSSTNIKSGVQFTRGTLSSRPTYQKIKAEREAASKLNVASSSRFNPASSAKPQSVSPVTSTPSIQRIGSTTSAFESFSPSTPDLPADSSSSSSILSVTPPTSATSSKAPSPQPGQNLTPASSVSNAFLNPEHVATSLSVIPSEPSSSQSRFSPENQDDTGSPFSSGSKNTLFPSGFSSYGNSCLSNLENVSSYALFESVRQKLLENSCSFSKCERVSVLKSCTLTVNSAKVQKAAIHSIHDFVSNVHRKSSHVSYQTQGLKTAGRGSENFVDFLQLSDKDASTDTSS